MLRRRQLIIDYNEIVWNAGQSNGFQPRSKDDEDLDGDEGDAQICSECGSLTVLQRYLFHRQRRFKMGSVEFYSEVELLTPHPTRSHALAMARLFPIVSISREAVSGISGRGLQVSASQNHYGAL